MRVHCWEPVCDGFKKYWKYWYDYYYWIQLTQNWIKIFKIVIVSWYENDTILEELFLDFFKKYQQIFNLILIEQQRFCTQWILLSFYLVVELWKYSLLDL